MPTQQRRTPRRDQGDNASFTVSGAEARRKLAAQEGEEITVTLAHPLRDGNPYTGEAQMPEDEIRVSRQKARELITIGYAAVDREDPAAVAEALGLSVGEVTVISGAAAAEGSQTSGE